MSVSFKISRPFYCSDKNIIYRSISLNNKVILIIHPFGDFKTQLKNNSNSLKTKINIYFIRIKNLYFINHLILQNDKSYT